jgi:hypothetical protein
MSQRMLLLVAAAAGCAGDIAGAHPGAPEAAAGSPATPAGGPGAGAAVTPAPAPGAGPGAGAGVVSPPPRPEPAAPVAPARDPSAAAAETELLRLPKAVYGTALSAVLAPLLGQRFDRGRLAGLLDAAPADDPGDSGYFEPAPPSGSTLRFYMETAERMIGAQLATSTSLPCLAEQGAREIACIEGWIATTGRRAFRRPLAADEIAGLRAQYTALRDAQGRGLALVGVLETLLTAPDFVFAIEGVRGGATSDVAPLDGFEIAVRLAIRLWASVPDDALLDAAARGDLDTAAGVEAAARRMLADKRARDGLTAFASQWLHFTERPLSEERREAAFLLEEVVMAGDARLATLLTTRAVWMNAHTATRYGAPAPTAPTRETYVKAELPPERMGILTMSGVLRGNGSPTASPIKRGKLVRERFFCQPVPEPPPDVPPLSAVKTGAVTLRQKLEQHRSDPACSGCHGFIDPIGFSLESFDHEAKYRTLDGKAPVDARGELAGTDVDGALDGAAALVERLARSRMVKDCVATQAFRYALGRREDRHDMAELGRIRDGFAKSDGNLRELLVALARSEAFRSRRTREIAK